MELEQSVHSENAKPRKGWGALVFLIGIIIGSLSMLFIGTKIDFLHIKKDIRAEEQAAKTISLDSLYKVDSQKFTKVIVDTSKYYQQQVATAKTKADHWQHKYNFENPASTIIVTNWKGEKIRVGKPKENFEGDDLQKIKNKYSK